MKISRALSICALVTVLGLEVAGCDALVGRLTLSNAFQVGREVAGAIIRKIP